MGNYNLKHLQANNVDFRYELFPGGSNQLLVGAFYKNIRNPIEYVYERPATSESVIEPENVGTATNFGGEFVYTHYFLKFGMSANYTYTHSNIPTSYKFRYTSSYGNDTVRYSTRNRPLQGQATHTGNLSLLYKDPKSGVELQLAVIYTGRHIVYLSQYGAPNASLDYWQRGTTVLDFSGEKSLGRHWALYAKLNNLLEYSRHHTRFKYILPAQRKRHCGRMRPTAERPDPGGKENFRADLPGRYPVSFVELKRKKSFYIKFLN